MAHSDTVSDAPLGRWSTRAFVASGVLWFGDTALLGLELLDIYAHGMLNGVLISGALLAMMVGLLGFYPRLSDRAPRLALGSAVLSGVALVGLVVTLSWLVAAIVSPSISTPPGAFLYVPLLALAFGGVVGLWTDVPSRTVGILLLAFLGVLLGATAVTGWLQFGLAGLLGLVALTIGYIHDADVDTLDSPERTPDSAA